MQVRKAIEDTAENELVGQNRSDIGQHPDQTLRDFAAVLALQGIGVLFLTGDDMQRDRDFEILRGRPEAVVRFVAVRRAYRHVHRC